MNADRPIIQLRPWAVEPFWKDDIGFFFMSWRRRAGKSFTMAAKSLKNNMEVSGNLNVFMSGTLRLGEEWLRKEAEVWRIVLDAYRTAAKEGGQMLESNADGLTVEDLMDLFEHNKFETKIWHDRTTYSRSIVIAPSPDSAVGFGGYLFLDEFGRMPDFKAILEAALPFIAENPTLRAVAASTIAPDDAHYSWELTVPPSQDFPVNPRGNWYKSEAGFICHRVDAYDTFAAGYPVYDEVSRKPLTPDEHRAGYHDKTAWDRNYGMRHIRGGAAAVNLVSLASSMALGRGQGYAYDITEELVA